MAANARKNLDGIELRKCCGCGFAFSAKDEYSDEELFTKSFADASREDLIVRARSQGHDKLVTESGISLIAQMFHDLCLDVVSH